MVIPLFSCLVQKTRSHFEFFFSLLTTHSIQCEIMLVLHPRYLKTTPTTFIVSIQVQADITCLDFALAIYWIGISSLFYLEPIAPLLCSKHCNGSLNSLRIKSQAQSILQGPMWFSHMSLLWPSSALPLSSLFQGMASLPFLEPTCFTAFSCALYLFGLSFMLLLRVFVWLSVSLSSALHSDSMSSVRLWLLIKL